jgi:hypothetical protein
MIEPIILEIDKPRQMTLPLGSLRRAERELNKLRAAKGLPLASIFQQIDEKFIKSNVVGIDLDLVITLLWASFLKDDPDIKVEDVERLDLPLMPAIEKLLACIQAWLLSGPKSQMEVGEADRPLALQNGSTSGPVAEPTSE